MSDKEVEATTSTATGTIIPDGRVSSLREEAFKYVKPLRQGFMLKEGGGFKSWKRRWFILRHNILYYYKDPQDIKSQGVVPLQDTMTEAVDANEKKKIIVSVLKIKPGVAIIWFVLLMKNVMNG